jgi:ketosteroid isomerase-like protein
MSAVEISADEFGAWLRGYQAAWEGRDPVAAAKLFSDDALYYWTPLVAPQRGPAEIAAVWEGAVSQQQDVRFRFEVFGVAGASGMARWRADFTRLPDGASVRLEGVLLAEFADARRCRVFREWWHSEERPA